jgi:hypothetical protein
MTWNDYVKLGYKLELFDLAWRLKSPTGEVITSGPRLPRRSLEACVRRALPHAAVHFVKNRVDPKEIPLSNASVIVRPGGGVRLPAPIAGQTITIINTGATSLDVFEYSGSKIKHIKPRQQKIFISYKDGHWTFV